ncbi:L-lactate permease [Striga asiatica]|uniref:L-lactate permease n=1 Tax=Striga asiatica TaxID=4170 RepID=A0A5A7QL39_STRAF|nr:L-lactate permease [Striga asiatica]
MESVVGVSAVGGSALPAAFSLLSSAVLAVSESVSLGLVKVDLLSDTEEAVIGRSVTERFCIEEITDAISALGGITAVGALLIANQRIVTANIPIPACVLLCYSSCSSYETTSAQADPTPKVVKQSWAPSISEEESKTCWSSPPSPRLDPGALYPKVAEIKKSYELEGYFTDRHFSFVSAEAKTQVAQRQACVELNDNTQRSFSETGGSLSKGRAKSTGQSQLKNWKKQ